MKRCFIENDPEDFFIKKDLDHIKDCCESIGIDFESDIDVKVFRAITKIDEVRAAVGECEEIYVSTGYIGHSADLAEHLLAWVIKHKFPPKKLINLRRKEYTYENRLDQKLLEKAKKAGHEFIYLDDIEL